jgi:hypothetical protein
MATVSLDSPSCEVPCLILHSVVYWDVTRQAKGLYCLKYVGTLERGLAYLNRCNSGWFCHSLTSEPRRAGSVSSRTAASELPFYDSNHSQVRCELLNLFPHLSLTTDEPPRWILIAVARLLLFKSIRDPNASLHSF